MKERDRGYTIDEVEMLEVDGVKEAIVKTSVLRITVEERDAFRAERQALVEAAVRATIEACAVDLGEEGFGLAAQFIRTADPAPIVARVLGGGR